MAATAMPTPLTGFLSVALGKLLYTGQSWGLGLPSAKRGPQTAFMPERDLGVGSRCLRFWECSEKAATLRLGGSDATSRLRSFLEAHSSAPEIVRSRRQRGAGADLQEVKGDSVCAAGETWK